MSLQRRTLVALAAALAVPLAPGAAADSAFSSLRRALASAFQSVLPIDAPRDYLSSSVRS